MTSAIPSFAAPVAPQMPAPASAPAVEQAQNSGFAQMLNQTRQAQQNPSKEAPSSSPAEEPSQERAPTARAAERGPKAEKQGKSEQVKSEQAKAGQAKGEKSAKAEAAHPNERAAQGEAGVAEGDSAKIEHDKADPALADWLAGLHLPPATPASQLPDAPKAAGSAAGDLEGKDAAALARLKGGAGSQAGADIPSAKGGRAAADASQARVKPEPSAIDAALSASKDVPMQATAEQAAAVQEMKPVHDFQQQLSALTHAVPTTGTARASESAAPVSVQMPVPATSPEFTQALGVQVSVLARDGVQQAELHLNPADMGPISIQIAIDGTQAQVNFGADLAATREIIENGLPELAASLRDAGFTLSGGGVHSQARGQGEGGGDGGREAAGRQDGPGTETDVTARRVQARVSAGGVDVYA